MNATRRCFLAFFLGIFGDFLLRKCWQSGLRVSMYGRELPASTPDQYYVSDSDGEPHGPFTRKQFEAFFKSEVERVGSRARTTYWKLVDR
jgi:hypothetical protein